MPKKEAPINGASCTTTQANSTTKNKETARIRIVEYLAANLRLTTIDSRESLGIMNPAQRISELRKKGAPIDRDWTWQADQTGALHRVRVYIWRGENAAQGELFGGAVSG